MERFLGMVTLGRETVLSTCMLLSRGKKQSKRKQWLCLTQYITWCYWLFSLRTLFCFNTMAIFVVLSWIFLWCFQNVPIMLLYGNDCSNSHSYKWMIIIPPPPLIIINTLFSRCLRLVFFTVVKRHWSFLESSHFSLSVIYIVLAVSTWAAPVIVTWIGAKMAMFLGSLPYLWVSFRLPNYTHFYNDHWLTCTLIGFWIFVTLITLNEINDWRV